MSRGEWELGDFGCLVEPSLNVAGLFRIRRLAFFLFGDGVLLAASLYAALYLRFDGHIPQALLLAFPLVWAISMACKVPLLLIQGGYSLTWSFVGIEDILSILVGVTIGWALFFGVMSTLRYSSTLAAMPWSVLLLDYVFSLFSIWGFRIARRVQLHLVSGVVRLRHGQPTLLVGAGNAGEQLVRSLLVSHDHEYQPVGFIDDDVAKHGTQVHSVPVLGGRAAIPRLVRQFDIAHVFIAMPSAAPEAIREVVDRARSSGVKDTRIVPALTRFLDGSVSLADLREVTVEDLLGRPVASIRADEITKTLGGKKVLITGAAGTIGGELTRQVLHFRPALVTILDHEETALFDIHRECAPYAAEHGVRLVPVLASVRDAERIAGVVQEAAPDIVFHAAAYKHVPILERNQYEAVRTNVLGTAIVARAAVAAGVSRFVLLSTDKAVKPSSVMGATKRVAEQVCLAFSQDGPTRFMAVRFGNVLGSRGSVIPIFQDQIRRGGPVTVRSPDVRRYFMAVSEAVLLVLQAAAIGQGGEVFVLDMGQPIKIVDLARDLIRLSGLEPDRDIPIVFTSLRPGEKDAEDILTAEEGTTATQHDKIYVARLGLAVSRAKVIASLDQISRAVERRDTTDIVSILRQLVPSYRPSDVALAYDRSGMSEGSQEGVDY